MKVIDAMSIKCVKEPTAEVLAELKWRSENYWKEPFKSKAFIMWYWRTHYMTEEEKDKEDRFFLIFIITHLGILLFTFIGVVAYLLTKCI
jgi:hypothetical protein